MDVTIDGVKLKNLANYRVQSALFDVIFPENNVFSVKPGTTKDFGDGYWVLLTRQLTAVSKRIMAD